MNENARILINISLRFVPSGPFKKYSSIGSDNGLAPTRRQAIIWTNDGLGYRYIYASLGLNELRDPIWRVVYTGYLEFTEIGLRFVHMSALTCEIWIYFMFIVGVPIFQMPVCFCLVPFNEMNSRSCIMDIYQQLWMPSGRSNVESIMKCLNLCFYALNILNIYDVWIWYKFVHWMISVLSMRWFVWMRTHVQCRNSMPVSFKSWVNGIKDEVYRFGRIPFY